MSKILITKYYDCYSQTIESYPYNLTPETEHLLDWLREHKNEEWISIQTADLDSKALAKEWLEGKIETLPDELSKEKKG